MNGMYINVITTMSGIVIIAACFAGFLVYLLKGRKEKDWRVVISVPMVISILVGAGYFGFGGSQVVGQAATKVLVPDVKQTLATYCSYVKDGNYNSIYDLLATDSPLRENETRAQFNQKYQTEWSSVHGVFNCTVGNDIEVNGDSATATITVINGLGQVIDTKMFLKEEDYEWKIITGSSHQE